MHRHRKKILLRQLKATALHFHRKRHPRKHRARNWHPFAILSMSMMIATGIVARESLAVEAEVLPPLDTFNIRPLDSTNMEVGQSLRLTAEGYYGTTPAVVKAKWNLLGNQNLGYFMDCEGGQHCTFRATSPGTAMIEAEANDRFAHVTVNIHSPTIPLKSTFTDELPKWAERPILDLRQRNVIHGYNDGRFGSADTLTRGQLITLIYRMLQHLQLVTEPGNCRQYYDDVRPDHFAYHAACLFWQRGWSSGLRRFDVHAPTSRAETAQFIYRIFGVPLLDAWGITLGEMLEGGELYRDVPTDHYAFYESAVLNRAGIMTGYGNGLFGPEENLNRAEAAAVIHRALQSVQSLHIRPL